MTSSLTTTIKLPTISMSEDNKASPAPEQLSQFHLPPEGVTDAPPEPTSDSVGEYHYLDTSDRWLIASILDCTRIISRTTFKGSNAAQRAWCSKIGGNGSKKDVGA